MFSAAGKTAAVATAANYIEDVFSTWLYTGTGTTLAINNGIDLAGKGGLVWIKNREAACDHLLFDTARGAGNALYSNQTTASQSGWTQFTGFTSTGFGLQGPPTVEINTGQNYASWTFRKQPKFFDVVTYTGTGSATTIAHNLGSVPGCIIVKATNNTSNWLVYHRSTGQNNVSYLNLTDPSGFDTTWNLTAPTSTAFSVSGDANNSGWTYVAYLFAHDAGGFGLTGTDNVVSCGTFSRTFGTANSVNLGYEPQWVLIKCTTQSDSWQLYDTMRGLSQTESLKLEPNSSNPDSNTAGISPTATGFNITALGIGGGTFIYIAIRRGPMKTPTTGTSVFSPIAVNNSAGTTNTTNFPIDFQWYGNRDGTANNIFTIDRLRGVSSTSSGQQNYLSTSKTNAEVTSGGSIVSRNWNNTGFQTSTAADGANAVYWNLRRAPGFFDVVCYTGTGSATTQAHNLGVVPELMIVKRRDASTDWSVYSAGLASPAIQALYLNLTQSVDLNTGRWNSTAPTASVFSLSGLADVNASGGTYVNYLFASCPGVSKCGSYTGSGTTKQIDCGFTGGARFVLIKRTDSTGDWYVWDSARGIVAGNDSYLVLNSTAAEVTNTDWVDTYSAGFELSNAAGNNVNINGASYIFLSVA